MGSFVFSPCPLCSPPPRLDVQKELAEKNTAVAIVIAALLLGIAYIAAHVVS